MNISDLKAYNAATIALPMNTTKHKGVNLAIIEQIEKAYPDTAFLFAKDYGVVADDTRLLDVTMTLGSDVVTSASAGFVAGDVGKVCKVSRALGGNDLTGTIIARISATAVQLDVTATLAVSNETAFYGTDDTGAWQDCLDAAWAVPAQSVEIIYFGWSVIAGPVITSRDGLEYRSQLVIKSTDAFLHFGHKAITINGIAPQVFTPNAGKVTFNPPHVGSGWHSYTTTPITGAGIIGTTSINDQPIGTNFEATSHIYLWMKNMGFMVPANAGISGGNYNTNPATAGYGAGISCIYGDKFCCLVQNDIVGTIDYPAFKSSYPYYEHVGFSGSNQNGETASGGDRVFYAGFYAGGLLGEHSNWGQISGQICVHPFLYKMGRYGTNVDVMLTNWCKYGPGPADTSGIPPAFITMHNIETHDGNDAYGNPAWWAVSATGGILYDPSNLMRGRMYYLLNGITTAQGGLYYGKYDATGDLSIR